jgi:hypothetical protein
MQGAVGDTQERSCTFKHEREETRLLSVCDGESLELSVGSGMMAGRLVGVPVERQNMCVSFPSFAALRVVVQFAPLALVFFR